jgi:hypothetical protein
MQASWHPKVFVGAYTGSMDPQIPPTMYRPSPVAVEIADGIGLGLDGQTLIVGQGADSCSITGHLQNDGSDGGPPVLYPQRDFTVDTKGNTTAVNGYFDWQNYKLIRSGDKVGIQQATPDFSSTVTDSGKHIHVDGAFPAQRYDIDESDPNVTRVKGYSGNESADVTYAQNKVTIQGNTPERTFEITKTANGLHVAGFRDDGNGGVRDNPVNTYDITFTKAGFDIQGYYPQQHYVINRA